MCFLKITLNNLTTNMILPEIKVNMYKYQLLRYIDDYQLNLNNKFD